MKVNSESEVAQLCLTLSNPMDCSLPGSSIHGIFQARVLERVAIAFSNGNPLWEDHTDLLDYTDLCWQSNVSAFQYTVQVCHRFPAKKQLSSDFMAAVTILSDFGAEEEEICHSFHLFPSICHAVMGTDAMILVFF